MSRKSSIERAGFAALKDVTAQDMRIIVKSAESYSAGLDRNARDRFRSSPHFELTADFCERFDQAAFDPAYESLPLEAFAPMSKRQPGRSDSDE